MEIVVKCQVNIVHELVYCSTRTRSRVKPSTVSAEMGTLGVIIAMCVCVHMHENVVFTFILSILSHIPSFPLDLIFLSQSPVTSVLYMCAYYDV